MDRDVIEELIHSLPLSTRRRWSIERELRTHLEESERDLQLTGMSPEQAKRESIDRLGDPALIAGELAYVHRAPPRRRVGLAFALAGALLMGAYGAGSSFASATSAHQQSKHLHPVPAHRAPAASVSPTAASPHAR